jgi:formate dehydrogenase major subunit
MYDSDCIIVMGSNMAENHPVAFRWPMKAKVEHGAKIIHVDPRFTRTSAVADIYAPVRAGSDIAFLGGMINYVINSEKWNTDPFFKKFVVNYTNAATIISEDFKDTEDLDGVFSGLAPSKAGVPEWPFNAFTNEYDGASWQYARTKVGAQGEGAAATAKSGETKVSTGPDGTKAPPTPAGSPAPAAAKVAEGPPFDKLVASLVRPPVLKDETLQNPRCVFQIVKRHFARYTPEMVEKSTGCPKDTFLKVAETILAN